MECNQVSNKTTYCCELYSLVLDRAASYSITCYSPPAKPWIRDYLDQSLFKRPTDLNLLPNTYANSSSGKTIEEYRRQLGSFGVSGDLALQTIASLSGGQKSRVAFARMCMGNPNFLVLDEPTNHLDIETIEALGKAIQKYTVSFWSMVS